MTPLTRRYFSHAQAIVVTLAGLACSVVGLEESDYRTNTTAVYEVAARTKPPQTRTQEMTVAGQTVSSFERLLSELRAATLPKDEPKDIAVAKDFPTATLGPAAGVTRRAHPWASRART